MADLTASPNLGAAKAIAKDLASDLQAFAKTTAAEIPVLGEAYGEVLRALRCRKYRR